MHFDLQTLTLLLAFKLFRVSMAWVAAFMAARVHQELYIDRVFLKQGDAPPLWQMLVTHLAAYSVLCAIVFAAMMAIAYAVRPQGAAALWAIGAIALVDVGIEVLTLAVVGTALAATVSRKKYFAYQYEGLRATRAFREMLFWTHAILAGTPYFLLVPPKLLAKMEALRVAAAAALAAAKPGAAAKPAAAAGAGPGPATAAAKAP